MKILILINLFLIIYAENNTKKGGNDDEKPQQKVPLQFAEPEPAVKLAAPATATAPAGLNAGVSSKFDNPNFIRDRLRNIINKPEMPPTWTNRHQQLYDSNWMDYCDPYHCNDYHRNVCGLNRRKMKFKWFQSGCHLILNNMCSNYRGSLKYDIIENKFCTAYVLFLRSGCPQYSDCDEHKVNPLCAVSSIDGHFVIFENKCYMDAVNCLNSTLQEYDEVKMTLCQKALYYDPDPVSQEIESPMRKKFLLNLGEGEI